MRRSFGGILLLVAAGLLVVGVGMFWLDRVAFSPDADTSTALAILADDDIRQQVTELVAGIEAPVLGVSPSELKIFLDTIARWHDGAEVMRGFVGDAHAMIIGDLDEPVTILAETQVEMVRNERVALEPPITLPVEKVGALSLINTIVGWAWIVSLGFGLITGFLGLFFRPEPGEFAFALGMGSIGSAISIVFFGWLIPATMLGALSDEVWVNLFSRLAANSRTTTFATALILVIVGIAIIFGTGALKPRRSSSTPLAMVRYRDEARGWSP